MTPPVTLPAFSADLEDGRLEVYYQVRKLEKLGYKGIDSAELRFEDYRIPADRLIGGAEGCGMGHAITGLELGRVNVAARGVGLAQAALDEAVKYSQQRSTFGKPIHQHQAIAMKLADMATKTQAARLLTEQAANALDRGERCDESASRPTVGEVHQSSPPRPRRAAAIRNSSGAATNRTTSPMMPSISWTGTSLLIRR